jgi:hypothetical protein
MPAKRVKLEQQRALVALHQVDVSEEAEKLEARRRAFDAEMG